MTKGVANSGHPHRAIGHALMLALTLVLTPPALRAQTWSVANHVGDTYDIVPANDGGFVAVGQESFTFQDRFRGIITKVDAQGVLQWQTTVNGPEMDSFAAVAAVTGGYVAVGRNDVPGVGNHSMIVKVNESGTVLWQRGSPTSIPTNWTGVVGTADGGAVVGGGHELLGTDFVILRLDASGNIEWATAYPVTGPATGSSSACGIVELPDGSLIVGTTIERAFSPFQSTLDNLLIGLDASGRVTWQSAFGAADEVEQILHLEHASDGIYATSWTHDGPTDRAMVARANVAGELQWAFTWLVDGSMDDFGGLCVMPDRGCVVTGRHDPVTNPTGRLLRFTPEGDLAWQHVIESERQIIDAAPAPGGFVVVGSGTMTRFDDFGTTRASCVVQQPGDYDVIPYPQDLWTPDQPWTAVSVALADLSLDVAMESNQSTCTLLDCPPLSCIGISVTPDPACTTSEFRLSLDYTGGEVITVDWDFNGDTLTDATGNPAFVRLPPGTHPIQASVHDACSRRIQRCTEATSVLVVDTPPVGEVSNVVAGAPALLVAQRGALITTEHVADATAYDARAGTIGSYFRATSAAGSRCDVPFTDNLDGTMTLDVSLAANSWLLVVGKNACRVGSAGGTSLGDPRDGFSSWTTCP